MEKLLSVYEKVKTANIMEFYRKKIFSQKR